MDKTQQNRIQATETAPFYDLFWDQFKARLTYAEVFRIHFIIDNIREFIPRTDLKILDLGCGRGWMAPFLSQFGKVTGIDFSPAGIKLGQEIYGRYGNFILADPQSPRLGLPATTSFDLVVCSEVIEHVPNPEDLLKQIKAFLLPEGWCIATTPNGRVWPQYKAGVQLISRIFKNNHGFQPVENWITPEKMVRLFQKLNFSIIRHEGQTLYRFGTPPLMSVGWLEAQFVDNVLRKFNLHHRYAKAILPAALYQIIIAKKSENRDSGYGYC